MRRKTQLDNYCAFKTKKAALSLISPYFEEKLAQMLDTIEDSEHAQDSSIFKMHPQMSMGPVSLRVRDLDRMLSFYLEDFGLRIIDRADAGDDEIVKLGACQQGATPLFILRYDPNAAPRLPNAAGLYHYAILLPDRKSLASAYLSLGNAGIAFDGFADHLVSEALYLTDPEGNGIEIYADRPRDQWKHDDDGMVEMATQPLDIDSLLKELPPDRRSEAAAIPEKARIGHVHLKVTHLKRSIDFYQRLLGFDLMSNWGSAAFLSIAGYHHHLGMNTWESLDGPGLTVDCVGLEYFTISVPDENFVYELATRLKEVVSLQTQGSKEFLASDPDGIGILVKASAQNQS